MSTTEHEAFMRRALELARQSGATRTPNPMVGALIVEEGRIVAEGAHAQDGGPHAERLALLARGETAAARRDALRDARPCSSHGARAPARRRSSLRDQAGRRGATDPNPAHRGRGLEVFARGGREVTAGVLERGVRRSQLISTTGSRTIRRCWGEAAVTLDGKIACRTGNRNGSPANSRARTCIAGGGCFLGSRWRDDDPEGQPAADGAAAREGRVVSAALRLRRAAAHGAGQESARFHGRVSRTHDRGDDAARRGSAM